jgi:hypothetical protein
MLFYLSLFEEQFSPLRVFQYITVRTVMGAGIAFFIWLAARNLLLGGGPWSSRWAGSEGGEKGVVWAPLVYAENLEACRGRKVSLAGHPFSANASM